MELRQRAGGPLAGPLRAQAVARAGLFALGLGLAATAGAARAAHGAPATPDRRPATADPGKALADLAAAYWDARLEADPITATLLGDRRFDDRLADITPQGRTRWRARLEGFRSELGRIARPGLKPADAITHEALAEELTTALDELDCDLGAWSIDPRHGSQVGFLNLATLQTVRTADDGRRMVARWQRMGPFIDAHVANLRRALGEGRVAPREAVVRVGKQLDDLLAAPDGDWILLRPLHERHDDWTTAERRAFEEGLRTAVSQGVRPAWQRYREVLRREILPRARDDAHAGLGAVPGGPACYRRLIRGQTSIDASPESLHQFGKDEIARIRAEMASLGKRALGTADLAVIQKRLRDDRTLYFASAEEIEAKAVSALRRAEAVVPRWFGRVPTTPCQVQRIPAYEEKDTTIAYYRQPAADGSRPGTYWVNTWAPATRPRFEAEVLAFHESVPGHHFQVALAQEMTSLPAFRRHAEQNAFIEGWALYTERLADAMGLYSGDLDRLGMLSFDAWRASRLVVDTGLHAMGWSRQQAIDYMVDNTILTRANIVNEVDRYLGTPAQALGYKVGQREFLRLRAQAEKALGPRFDIRAFHDTVLGQGAVSLSILRGVVERWIAQGGR